jgi:Domain of unknown function (DUF4349)
MPSLHSLRSASTRRRGPWVALAIVATVALAACSSGASSLSNTGNAVGAAPAGAPAPTAAQGAGTELDTNAYGSGRNAGDGSTNPGDPNAAPRDTALIVMTGTMTIQTDDVGAALLKARADVIRLGGYISGSEQSRNGDRVTASVTYRFPSDRWEDVLDALKARGELKDEKTDSLEVTGQVVDLDARIANLRATERALQAIMQKATRIPDILEVQNQLTQVQGQIEGLAAQVAHLRDQASLSTLTVIFQTPPVPVVKETSKAWSPGVEFDRAVALLLSIGQGLLTIGIWLAIVVLPVGLGFGFLIVLLAILGRRFGRWPVRPAGPPAMAAGPDA